MTNTLPFESGEIIIARAQARMRFPARFQLVAAMNPCPCGYLGDSSGRCRCTPDQIQRYIGKLSGPLLDRIDLHLHIRREALDLSPAKAPVSSADLRPGIAAARDRQRYRQGLPNAALDLDGLRQHCLLRPADQAWFEAAGERLILSLRALHRILKVARTLADMEGVERIERPHLAEAMQYRAQAAQP